MAANRTTLNLTAGFTGFILLTLATLPVHAQVPRGDWQYIKSVSLPDVLNDGDLVEISLDAEVFAGSQPDLDDLRLITNGGTEVPYKLEVLSGIREQTPIHALVRDVGYLSGGYTTFLADVGSDGLLHNQIEIKTPEQNFRRTVTIDASDDKSVWVTIAEQEIFNLTIENLDVHEKHTLVGYPESTKRYLRVRVEDDGQGKFDISGASISYLMQISPSEFSRTIDLFTVETDDKQGITIVEMDLGIEGFPVNRLDFYFSDVNIHRQVELHISSDRLSWRPVLSRSAIFAYDTPKSVGISRSLKLPEITSRYIQLLIHNGSNKPINIHSIEAISTKRRLVFEAKTGYSYELMYGNRDVPSPLYDFSYYFQYLETENLNQARVGPQSTNPQFKTFSPVTERLGWLLPVVLSGAALITLVLLFPIFRNAKKLLKPADE